MNETEKIAVFLRDHYPSVFCVGCLGRQLHLSVEAVTLATIELGLRSGYGFTDAHCSRCGRRDTVLGLKTPSGGSTGEG
jgi:hypothetical protein